MTILVFIRHGLTEWNEHSFVQGRSDVPLSKKGRMQVSEWQVPKSFKNFDIVASPLLRARETATILFGKNITLDKRLVEMDWSEWEGRSLSDLRAELGNLMEAWEKKGLDFKAPNGESPREVQYRLMPFMREIAIAKQCTVAVCHKGVIRAAFALATNWDMKSKPSKRLRDDCFHLFKLTKDGQPHIHKLNVPMI